MRVENLTRHFVERWETGDGDPSRRVHLPVDIETVNRILDESIVVQRQKLVYVRHNGTYVPYTVLAAYWHPTMHLLLKVDEYRGMAVTVINRRRLDQQSYFDDDDIKVGGTD